MLSNSRKRYLDPQQEQQPLLSRAESQASASDTDYPDQGNDAVAPPHWAISMTEPAYVMGCACPFCSMHSKINHDADPGRAPAGSRSQSYARRSLPSTRSIMQVLYPPSYLGTPRPFPDPPSYSARDSPPHPTRGDDAEISPLISTTIEGAPLSPSRPDPLAQDPSLTGVPSQGTPLSSIPPTEPNPPIIALDVPQEIEQLPAYSRFDQRRPRFPAASSVLGPYPSLPVLGRTAP